MRKLWAILFLSLLALPALSQQPPGPTQVTQLQLLLNTSTPPVQSASVAIVGGTPGNQTIYYWIVANYAVGSSSPAGPFIALRAPNTLNGSNFIAISPTYPLGSTSVDILKTSTAVAPSGACNCAVATGQTSATINDQSNSTSAYTVTPFVPTQFTLTLDNEVISAGVTHLILRQNGTQVADLSVGGGGGSGTVNPGSTGHFAYYGANGTAVSDLGTSLVFTSPSFLSLAGSLTAQSGATLDLSAIGGSGTLKIPTAAGCIASATRMSCYDSTAALTHQLTAGADSISMATLATDTNANHVPFATGTPGIWTSRAIGIADLPGSGVANQVFISTGAGTGATGYKGLPDLNSTEYAVGGGTAQTQTVTLAPAATSLTTGLLVRWKPNAANTAAGPTLAVNALPGTVITKCGTTALVANDLITTAIAEAVYDGTEFQLLNPQQTGCGAGGGGGGSVTSVGLSVNSLSSSGIVSITGSPVTASGTLNFAFAGNSGGHPYFSSASVLSSTTAQTTHGIWLAEGPGNADVTTAAGTLNQLVSSAGASSDPIYKSLADLNNTEYIAGGGTAQAQVVTLAPAATALVAGLTVRWKPTAANTGAGPTLAVNGLTATAITKCGTTALVANDLLTTAIATATYDGTEFQLLNPQASGCGSSGSGTVNAAVQFAVAYYPNAGTNQVVGGVTPPTSPAGVPQILVIVPSGGSPTAPTFSLPGIVGRNVTIATDTILSTDCSPNRVEYTGSAAVAVTLPTATTLGVPACVYKISNQTTGSSTDVTITPTTWTINGAASLAVHQGEQAWIYVDPASSTNWIADRNESAITAGTNITLTRSAQGLTIGETSNTVTVNGATCQLGLTCNVNGTNTAHSVALNEGAGVVLGAAGPGTLNQLLASAGAADPGYKSLADLNSTEYVAGGGTAQAQTVTLAPAATSLVAGLTVRWKPTAANTAGGPTLAVNGLTATTITKCGATALVANDLTTGAVATATYDGTDFQLLNPQQAACGGGGGGSSAESSITAPTTTNTITESAAGDWIARAGVETANLTAPWSFVNTNSTNNNTSLGLLVGAAGTSTGGIGAVIYDVSGTGDLVRFYSGGSVTSNVYTPGTLEFEFTAAGNMSLGGATIPPLGTAGGAYATEGTGFTGASGSDGWYANSSNHCVDLVNGATDVSCAVAVGQANTFGAFLQSFASATGVVLPATGTSSSANTALTIQSGIDTTTTGAGFTLTLKTQGVNGGTAASLSTGALTIQSGSNASTGNTNSSGAVTIFSGDLTGGTGTGDTGGTVTVRGANCTGTTGSCTPGSPTLIGGGFTAAFTNGAGSDAIVAGGLGTGNATPSHVKLQAPGFSSTSGTTAQAEVTTYVVHKKAGSTTSGTATNMFQIPVAASQTIGVEIIVHVETTQATPHNCSTTENFIAAVQNTGGTVTQQSTSGTIGTSCDTGTLTLAVAFSTATPSVFSVTPSWTTIAPTAVIITVEVHNLSQQDITLL